MIYHTIMMCRGTATYENRKGMAMTERLARLRFGQHRVILTLFAASVFFTCFTGVAALAQTVMTTNARYPRLIKLPGGELIATVLGAPNDFSVKVFSSTDSGKSFRQVGKIADAEFLPRRTSSPSVYRLPKAVGSLREGTLVLGLNVDTGRCETCRSKINIYKSTDNGRNWSFVSEAVRSANSKGLWEPDFSMATDGALVLHYADESSSCCSQKLVRRRTYDGRKWTDHTNTVALAAVEATEAGKKRPGMPVVSILKSGAYLMTYEICGQAEPLNCATYYKTSKDGWDYGDIRSPGTRMVHGDGSFVAHTPVNLVLPDGALLVSGQYMNDADGNPSARNGTVLFRSASGSPDGPWTFIPAPVTLPNPTRSGCEGFSPAFQTVADGNTLVQVTSLRNATGACDMFFATAPLK